MNLDAFLTALSRHRTTFAIVCALTLTLGLTLLLTTPTQHVSSTRLLVTVNGSTTASAYQNDDVARERVNSYLSLLTSDVVSRRVIEANALSDTPAELAARVSATRVPPNTSIIDVAVTAPAADQAQTLADSYAREFIKYATALETPTGRDAQKVRVSQISNAGEPRANTVARVLVGLLIALAAALLGSVAVWIRSTTTTPRRLAAHAVPTTPAVSGSPQMTNSKGD